MKFGHFWKKNFFWQKIDFQDIRRNQNKYFHQMANNWCKYDICQRLKSISEFLFLQKKDENNTQNARKWLKNGEIMDQS